MGTCSLLRETLTGKLNTSVLTKMPRDCTAFPYFANVSLAATDFVRISLVV
jgi:hypothetical protein